MKMIDPVVAEFNHEMATTRKLLAAIPDADLNWNPHTKSMTLGRLASHIVELALWTQSIFDSTELDMKPGQYKPTVFKDSKSLLDTFDANVAIARKTLEAQPDAALAVNWSFKIDGNPLFSLPRSAVMRTWVLNHIIHHRGQLSVYLRLRSVAVPEIYGPTADSK